MIYDQTQSTSLKRLHGWGQYMFENQSLMRVKNQKDYEAITDNIIY